VLSDFVRVGKNDSHKHASLHRRFPRVFLTASEETLTPVSGILLALPDRTHIPILSMSAAGVIVPTQGVIGQLRLGQVLECKLKFAVNLEPVILRLKVMRLTAQFACLAIDTLAFDDRLKIEQVIKDQIIFSNLHVCSNSHLPGGWKGSEQPEQIRWWSGPFDTNLLVCLSLAHEAGSEPQVLSTLIEYDGIILSQEMTASDQWFLKRSVPTVDESKGYAGPWFDEEPQKISMGTNWRARLLRLLETSEYAKEFEPLILSLNQF
jgi:hypothetical protein